MDSLLNFASALNENLHIIMDYAMLGACALLSLATSYANTSKKVGGNMIGLISQAEAEFQPWQKSGVLKHKWVVDILHEELPAPFRPLFPKKRLEKLVGETFDSVSKFIELQQSGTPQSQAGSGKGESTYSYLTPDSYAGYAPEDGYILQTTAYDAPRDSRDISAQTGIHYVNPGGYHVVEPGGKPF